jgi:hypothetical protein
MPPDDPPDDANAYRAYTPDDAGDDTAPSGNGSATAAPRFAPVRFKNIKWGTEPPFLVQGIIPRWGLTVIWGEPKSGKSFWTFDLVMHIALGREYRGQRVQPGPSSTSPWKVRTVSPAASKPGAANCSSPTPMPIRRSISSTAAST